MVRGPPAGFLEGGCGCLAVSCERPELTGRDADHALEVAGELALVREAGVRGDLRQGQFRFVHEPEGPGSGTFLSSRFGIPEDLPASMSAAAAGWGFQARSTRRECVGVWKASNG